MANELTRVKPYGFIIYRGDYSDDARWEQFMAYLKHQTRSGLESEGKSQLYDWIDWKVISSPDLQDEDPDVVCKIFQQWLEYEEEEFDPNSYRHRACIYVNEGCLECHDSFIQGKSLENDDPVDLVDTEGFTFAILVSKFEEEEGVMVGTSYLIPRAGNTIMTQGEGRNWSEIYRGEGEVSVRF